MKTAKTNSPRFGSIVIAQDPISGATLRGKFYGYNGAGTFDIYVAGRGVQRYPSGSKMTVVSAEKAESSES